MARPGEARRGSARQGWAWQGKARKLSMAIKTRYCPACGEMLSFNRARIGGRTRLMADCCGADITERIEGYGIYKSRNRKKKRAD